MARATLQVLVWLACAALLSAQEGAPAPRPSSGHMIPVVLPITGTVDTQIKQAITRILDQPTASDTRPLLVLEFSATEGRDGTGSEFERCLSLARFLVSERLSRVRTVAYLRGDVLGHAVLAVLACEEIVMHPAAVLGDAGRGEPFIDETMRRAYSEAALRRRTVPVAVALGMLDPQRAVSKVTSLEGVSYVLADELDELRQRTTISAVDSVVQQGDLARFTGRQLRYEYGFVSHLAEDRRALATALELPLTALEEDPSAGEVWRPLRLDLSGPMNAQTVNFIVRSTEAALVGDEANFLCLVIDSPGGSVDDSVRLATFLSSLEGSRVRSVAYVPREALSDAALVALACDELVMAPEARLGGGGARIIRARNRPQLRVAVRAVAKATGRDWSLPAALVDPTLTVYRFAHQGTGEIRYLAEEELADDDAATAWRREAELDLEDGLPGREVAEMQLASHLADNFAQLRQQYSLPDEIPRLQPNWALLLIESLASPRLAGILLFVAWFTLFIEFSQPGLGIPGFVSGICFMLYFWSNALQGTAGWLEVLLFLAGVVSLLLEIFVVPGFGVFGLGGAALVIASIVLASQTFVIPRNSYQMQQLPNSLLLVVAACGGAFASLVVMRHYLPEIPVLRRLLLAPPDDEDLVELDKREALADFEYLRGKRGRTVTPLTPSGKARFGDEVVNVISDGELVASGVDVWVAEVRGAHVSVRVVS